MGPSEMKYVCLTVEIRDQLSDSAKRNPSSDFINISGNSGLVFQETQMLTQTVMAYQMLFL